MLDVWPVQLDLYQHDILMHLWNIPYPYHLQSNWATLKVSLALGSQPSLTCIYDLDTRALYTDGVAVVTNLLMSITVLCCELFRYCTDMGRFHFVQIIPKTPNSCLHCKWLGRLVCNYINLNKLQTACPACCCKCIHFSM